MASVVKDWLAELPLRMQSTVLLAMRGPDNCAKENAAKILCRAYRFVCMHPAFPFDVFPSKIGHDIFMGDQTGVTSYEVVKAFIDDHDGYPHHWILHFTHGAEIIGQYHPDNTMRLFWWTFYTEMARAMHMNIETLPELEERLKDPCAKHQEW
jgi:hypothetical protein